MIIARIIFFSLMALIGLILLGSFIFFYYIAGRNGRALKYTSETAPRSMRDYIRQTEEAEEEIRTMNRQPVEIVSAEGYRLRGNLYTMNPGTKTVVLALHGYHSGDIRDMGRFLPMYKGMGYDCLVPQMRCHGESEGHFITFGFYEQVDGIAWCRKLEEIYGSDVRILLHGMSMGGATALMMCRNRMLPDTVKAVIADSANDTLKNLVDYRYRRIHAGLRHVGMELINMWFMLLAGVDYKDITALKGTSDRKIPALFVHSMDDRVIPVSMYQSNREAWEGLAAGFTVSGVPHANAYVKDPEAYEARIRDLMQYIEE